MKWEQAYASLADQSLSLPRFGHSAVASTDCNGSAQVVIYGGVGCHAGETAQTALGDVAVLQVDSGTWSAADIQPGPSPGPRAFHSAVALAGGRSMLLFGGHILTYDSEHNRKRRNFYNDIWQLDLVEWQWRQLPCDSSSNSSPARRDMSALLQLQDGRLVLFGGRSEQGKALQDTWAYHVDSNMWQQLKPVGALPPARKMHSMVQVGQQVVLFGGESDSGPLDDVWLLGGWGPGEVLRWTQLRLRASPQPRFGHAMAVCSVAAGSSGSEHGDSSSSSTVSSDAEQLEGDQPPSPFVTAAAAAAGGGGGSTTTADSTPAGVPAEAPAAAAAATAGGAVDGSSSGGDKGRQQQQRVVVFGGCLDLSGFLSLNKNYVQSKDTWLLQLDSLTWLQLQQPSSGAMAAAVTGAAATAAAAEPEPEGSLQPVPWPCERMCHSLTALPDGRLLVFGGRNKEGICSDMWLLDTSGEVSLPAEGSAGVTQAGVLSPGLPPASPRPSTAGSTGSSSAAAAAKPSPSRPGSQSLLQSLLGPVRARVPSQGLLARRDSASAQQQGAGPASTPPTSTPSSSLPASPKRSQQQQLEAGGGSQPGLEGLPAAAGDSAAQQQQHQHQQGGGAFAAVPAAAAAAAAAAVAAAAPGSTQQQALATLMDVSSGEFAKLLRNPAAYSAGAIGKLSSSVTSTMSSLLVGKDGQPGAMLPRLPEGLMRLPHWAPTGPFSSRSGDTSSSQTQKQNQGVDMPALAPLRQQMGLLQGAAAAAGGGHGLHELKAPAHIQQELATLGHLLLTDGGGGGLPSGSLPTEVLIAAARQYLMATQALQLRLRHVALLLADYQELAASYSAHMMLSRLSEGFSAAAAANGASKAVADGGGQSGPAFLQRRPTDLLVHQVDQLQQKYQHLLVRNAA